MKMKHALKHRSYYKRSYIYSKEDSIESFYLGLAKIQEPPCHSVSPKMHCQEGLGDRALLCLVSKTPVSPLPRIPVGIARSRASGTLGNSDKCPPPPCQPSPSDTGPKGKPTRKVHELTSLGHLPSTRSHEAQGQNPAGGVARGSKLESKPTGTPGAV